LGLRLGLHKNTLDAIKRDSDTTNDCLIETLSQWLSRADNVDSKGGATFDSLSDALKSMNENAAADKLDQEKRNAMISGNDIKGTNDVHSTGATGPAPPTGTNEPLIGGPPLSPIALMDIPDDRPTVSELIEFHELLIKGQPEESLPLLDADTIRKIRNATSDHEKMSLLRKVFEEHPRLLHEMRVATGKIKGIKMH
uniref:Death domain-containing protein n=1 Tax=Amphimedon queenslandica TaxID=400682 RepID=A0A1X7SIY9_AMPQE